MTDMAGGGWSNSLVGTVLSFALGVNDSERSALEIARTQINANVEEKKETGKTKLEYDLVELLKLYQSLGLDPADLKERFDKRIKSKA